MKRIVYVILILGLLLGSLLPAISVYADDPILFTDPAGAITKYSAILNGSLSTMGDYAELTVYFQWGINTSYGNFTRSHEVTGYTALSDDIYGLSNGQTYHFRIAAVGFSGSYHYYYGSDQSFVASGDIPETGYYDRVQAPGDWSAVYFDAGWTFENSSSEAAYFLIGGGESITNQGGALGFQALYIPQGSEITSAYLTFDGQSSPFSSESPGNLVFRGEVSANTTTFSNLAGYQANRGVVVAGANDDNLTSANVPWGQGGPLDPFVTPDLSTIFQEIVDEPTWDSGDTAILFLDDHAGESVDTTMKIGVNGSNPGGYPTLHIEYSPAPELTEVLWYQPNTIISGTTLPDRDGDQNGVITWGSNPSGISVILGNITQGNRAILNYIPPTPTNPLGGEFAFPPQMYTELDTSKIPGGDIVNEILDQSDTPPALWWFTFIFLLIAIVGLMVFDLTQRTGGEGSLLLMCIVMEAGLVLFGVMGTVGTSSIIPLFPAFLFPIPAVALIISKNSEKVR